MKPVYKLIFLCFFILSLNSCKQKKSINSGEDLIEAVYDKWKDNWYKNMAFSQEAIFYKSDTVFRETIWHEIYSKGKLAIKFDSLNSGNGIVFRNDSVYIMKQDTIASISHRIHDLLVLGLDIANVSPETTISKLKTQKYNLQKVEMDILNGRKTWVVGDKDKNQFWIDAEKLCFIKMISFNEKGTKQERTFKNYKTIDGKWTATEVEFKDNDQLILLEKYFNIRFPEDIDKKIFDAKYFKEAKW